MILSERLNSFDSPETAGLYLELGFFCLALSEHAKANKFFLKSIEITHFVYPKNVQL